MLVKKSILVKFCVVAHFVFSLFPPLSVDLSFFETAIFSATSSAVWPASHQPLHQPRDFHPTSSATFPFRCS